MSKCPIKTFHLKRASALKVVGSFALREIDTANRQGEDDWANPVALGTSPHISTASPPPKDSRSQDLKSLHSSITNGIIRRNGVNISCEETIPDAGENHSSMRYGVSSSGLQYVPGLFPYAAFWAGPAQ